MIIDNNKKGFSRLLCIILFLSFHFVSHATHLIGGEIRYEQVSANNYFVYVTIYRDCGPLNTNNTGFDEDIILSVWDAVNYSSVMYGYSDDYFETPVYSNTTNPCAILPPELCIEKAEYYFDITIPSNPNGLVLSYQRCCFGDGVAYNIAGTPGLTNYCIIPPDSNNSPYFNSDPPLGICIYDDINLNLSMTDPDGDSLSYSIFTPFTGGDTINPIAITPPPFTEMVWEVGYSLSNPINANPGLEIDSITGLITGVPSTTGYFILGVLVEEFRNSEKIGEYIRTFRYVITDCELAVSLMEIDKDQYCDDLNYQFLNTGGNSVAYYWDFGDPGSSDNSSTLENPSHIYPDYGSYMVTFISYHDIVECSDTLYYSLEVEKGIEFEFNYEGKYCLSNNSYDFEPDFVDSTQIYHWDFGGNAVPAFSSDISPSDVHFNTLGIHTVTLTIDYGECKMDFTEEVLVEENLINEVEGPEELCLFEYGDYTTSPGFSYPVGHNWKIDGENFSLKNVSLNFEYPGFYDLYVQIYDPVQNCSQEVLLEDRILVRELPVADFELKNFNVPLNEKIGITDLSGDDTFVFYVVSTGDTIHVEDPTYIFTEEGEYSITQFSSNEFCENSVVKEVIVSPHFLTFPNAFSPNGDGENENFRPKGRLLSDMLFYRLEVYDRWGKQLFETDDPFEGWMGKDLYGKPSKAGFYIWHVDYATYAKHNSKQGFVTLLK